MCIVVLAKITHFQVSSTEGIDFGLCCKEKGTVVYGSHKVQICQNGKKLKAGRHCGVGCDEFACECRKCITNSRNSWKNSKRLFEKRYGHKVFGDVDVSYY